MLAWLSMALLLCRVWNMVGKKFVLCSHGFWSDRMFWSWISRYAHGFEFLSLDYLQFDNDLVERQPVLIIVRTLS